MELYQQKRVAEAERVFESILAKRSDMTHVYRHLGALRWETGRPEAAIATLERAMKAGVSDAALQAQLGVYLAEAGQPAVAIPLLEAITAGTTPDVDAVNARHRVRCAGRLDRAVAGVERVLRRSTNAMEYENIGSIKLRRDAPAARAALERAAALNPHSAARSWDWARSRCTPATVKPPSRVGAAPPLDPSELEALYNLATGLAAAGRRAEARPYAEAFLKQAPPALFCRGRGYAVRRRRDRRERPRLLETNQRRDGSALYDQIPSSIAPKIVAISNVLPVSTTSTGRSRSVPRALDSGYGFSGGGSASKEGHGQILGGKASRP